MPQHAACFRLYGADHGGAAGVALRRSGFVVMKGPDWPAPRVPGWRESLPPRPHLSAGADLERKYSSLPPLGWRTIIPLAIRPNIIVAKSPKRTRRKAEGRQIVVATAPQTPISLIVTKNPAPSQPLDVHSRRFAIPSQFHSWYLRQHVAQLFEAIIS
jgi:hypothetical protein